jgi:preprotein translocase subunit SecD
VAACASWLEEPDLGGTALVLHVPSGQGGVTEALLNDRMLRAGTRRGRVTSQDGTLTVRVPAQIDAPNISIAQRGELSVLQVDEQWTSERIGALLQEAQGDPHTWARAEGRLPVERVLRRDETTGGWIVVYETPSLTHAHIAAAHPVVGLDAQASVRLRLDEQGKELLRETTRAARGERLAFELDGALIATPVVAEILDGGTLHLTLATEADAAVLAAVLATGPLPQGVAVRSSTPYAPGS